MPSLQTLSMAEAERNLLQRMACPSPNCYGCNQANRLAMAEYKAAIVAAINRGEVP